MQNVTNRKYIIDVCVYYLVVNWFRGSSVYSKENRRGKIPVFDYLGKLTNVGKFSYFEVKGKFVRILKGIRK